MTCSLFGKLMREILYNNMIRLPCFVFFLSVLVMWSVFEMAFSNVEIFARGSFVVR